MHSSINVANKLLELAKKDRKTLTPMQLIKLVFLCQGWMLGLYGRHLINDPVEAWRYGPVLPDLYNKIKQFRSNPVTHIEDSQKANHTDFDEEETDIIKQVYNIYGNMDGIQLSVLTHEKDGPWDKTWKNGKQIISNDLIENYYQNKAQTQ